MLEIDLPVHGGGGGTTTWVTISPRASDVAPGQAECLERQLRAPAGPMIAARRRRRSAAAACRPRGRRGRRCRPGGAVPHLDRAQRADRLDEIGKEPRDQGRGFDLARRGQRADAQALRLVEGQTAQFRLFRSITWAQRRSPSRISTKRSVPPANTLAARRAPRACEASARARGS